MAAGLGGSKRFLRVKGCEKGLEDIDGDLGLYPSCIRVIMTDRFKE